MLFSPDEHPKRPPETWTVRKHGRRWLLLSGEHSLDSFATKREAERAKTSGFLFDLYHKEGRWFAGEHVEGWRPYQGQADRCNGPRFHAEV